MATYKATRVYEIGGKKYRAWQDQVGHWRLYDADDGTMVAYYVHVSQMEESITHMIQRASPDYGVW